MIPFFMSTGESALVRGGFFRRSRKNKGKTNMKQLKFMLAAATVIGLATAAQAAASDQFATSTDFEGHDVSAESQVVTTGTDSYFYYGGVLAENDSKIISGAPTDVNRPKGVKYFETKDTQAKLLKVNTGATPLFRALDTFNEAPVSQEITEDTYIDTLVQFTVTPYTDEVESTGADKLMIYLKEATNDVGVITGTNLVVKAGFLTRDGIVSKDYVVRTTTPVEAGNWYRLTVKAIPNLATDAQFYYPAFSISINGSDWCSFDSGAIDNTDEDVIGLALAACGDANLAILSGGTVVLPLGATGSTPATLSAVGFAGEGYVDDFIVTTEDPLAADPTGIDFTLTLAPGVSAVTYVIGSADPVKITERTTLEKLEAAKITISVIDYLVGYKAGDNGAGEYDVSADGLTIDAVEVVINDGTAEGSTATTAADLQITNAKFANDSPAQLTKLTTWAKNYSVSLSTVNGMTFADEEVESEAYLLNCAPTAKAVEDAKAAFKFPAITAGEVPAVYEPQEGYTVAPKIFGADSIEALKTSEVPATAGHKFFKAVLTK